MTPFRIFPLILVTALAAASPADAASGRNGRSGDPVTQLAPIVYTAIDGHHETLVPWQGRYVSVLVEQGRTRDPVVMTELVDALDRAWSYYAAATGRLPGVGHSLNRRDEVAEVTSTCGAGCTYIGATGTEMLISYFENMYQQIAASDQYDQVPFYELGRSFWFWSPALEFKPPDQDPVVTGFAVLMRFESMAAAGVAGAPYNGTPFPTFAAGVQALAGQYEADPSKTFAGTLAQDKSPGAYGGTDFWASLMMQLARRHGGQVFLTRFFHVARSLPAASSTAGAVTNWLRAANDASCTDLSQVFYTRWGFPRPDGSVTSRPPARAVPEPPGSCPAVSVGRVRRAHTALRVPVTCYAGACRLVLRLTIRERRGKNTRIVTVGRVTSSLALGEGAKLRVRLGANGRRRLRRRHELQVTLRVIELRGSRRVVLATRLVTFRSR